MHGARRTSTRAASSTSSQKSLLSNQSRQHSRSSKSPTRAASKTDLNKRIKLRVKKVSKHPFSTTSPQPNSTPEPQYRVTYPVTADDVDIAAPLPHDPQSGIPCNFIELPGTIAHPVTVKPWSTISFTDNLPRSSTFTQMQDQVSNYLDNGGRVLKLYPGYEPYMFESIASHCRLARILPDDLTLILPVSAHEIKTGLYPAAHPVLPHFFTKQDKINHIRENCPKYVPHRRGYFVHKIIQQLTTKIDGLNVDKVLNLPIEFLYEDYPSNYDPREGGFVVNASNTTLRHNAQNHVTEIELADFDKIDPMDYLATQELPEGHIFKKSSYNGTTPIALPSGRYPADRLRDKVYQVTSHLGSESVDLVVINELEHVHQDHMQNVYDLVLESFFQCELLVIDGKTRGYGLSSRLISTPYHHDNFLSPYKVTLLSNFAAELARLYKGLPAKDPYFHPQQFRLLMDICMGAVLPPASIVDDMYGDFKQEFMDKYSKPTPQPEQHESTQQAEQSQSTPPTTPPPQPDAPKGLDQLYSSLKKSLESQGVKLAELTKEEPPQKKKPSASISGPKMSDYFNGAFSSFKPVSIDDDELDSKFTAQNSQNDEQIDGAERRVDRKHAAINLSTNFVSNKTPQPQLDSKGAGIGPEFIAPRLTSMLGMGVDPIPTDINSDEFKKLSPQQQLIKKQFETIGTQLNIVLQAKRLTMLAGGSTPEDRLRIQQKQQVLLDNYMLLPEEVDVTHPDVIDKLYAKDSQYTLIDASGGERAKFKDLLAAKRVLALKGEGFTEMEIQQLKNAKDKVKKLLQNVGGDDIMMKDGRIDPNKLNIGLDQLAGVNMEDEEELDRALDKYLETEFKLDAESRKALTATSSRHQKLSQIEGVDELLADPVHVAVDPFQKIEQSLDRLYEQELFLDADVYDNVDESTHQPHHTPTTSSSQSTISAVSKSQHKDYSSGLPANAEVVPNTNIKSSLSPSTRLDPIAADKVDELFNTPMGPSGTRPEDTHFAMLEEMQKQHELDQHEIDEHGQLLDTSHRSKPNSIKDVLALKTNFNNYKYYNPYSIISKDKLRSEMLEFQLMTSLSRLLPNDDVKALVKHATQYAEKVQAEIRVAAARRVAIMKLDLFFEKAQVFKQRYLAQKDTISSEELSQIEQLMLQVRPKMVLNWEQWKRGERKRQFNNEVAFSLESEFSNIFQNIIYKTIINTQPELFKASSIDRADSDDEHDDSAQPIESPQTSSTPLLQGQTDPSQAQQTTGNTTKRKSKKPKTGDLKMPKLKLGQLFKTDTMKQLYKVVTGKDPAIPNSNEEKLTDQQKGQIEEVYGKLSPPQQQELERIAMYIPLYTSTGILPLFPSATLKKHHDTREMYVSTEMKRQLQAESDYKARREAEIDHEIDHEFAAMFTNDGALSQQEEKEKVSKKRQKKAKLAENFDPNYRAVVGQNALLTQDMTWYNDDYVPLWMCNKRQSRLLLLEPEVNIGNYTFTTQRTHPVPTTKPQWKKYKEQQQFQTAPGEGESEVSKQLSKKEKQVLYHIDTDHMTLITPHQYAIQQGMLVLTQNTYDVTVDDKTIRLLDRDTVHPGMQQKLNDYLTHALSYLRTIERSYPYQARDSLAKNLPPVLSVSTAQMLQMELPYITTVPELEQVLYSRLLPQLQGAVNVLQQHEEFEQFAAQLAVAGEKTKSSAEACISSYNTPIVSTAERQLANLHHSLKVIEDISSQLIWIALGLGFDSVGVPQGSLTTAPVEYLNHVMMVENETGSNHTGQLLATQQLAIRRGKAKDSSLVSLSHRFNGKDISEVTVLSREEALSVLQTASLQVIPVLKKKLNDLQEHLNATPYSRQTKVAVAATDRPALITEKLRQFHMIGSTSRGDSEIDQKLLESNPMYRHYQQELAISKELENLYKLNPFVPAELSFNPKYKLSSKSESHLLLLQYENIHQLNRTKAAQH